MIDKRRQARIFFTFDDDIGVAVRIRHNGREPVAGVLLSLSRGGLSFSLNRGRLPGLQPDIRLSVDLPDPPGELAGLPPLDVTVRYVLDFDTYARLSVGCEFAGLDDGAASTIERYVREWLAEWDGGEEGAEPAD